VRVLVLILASVWVALRGSLILVTLSLNRRSHNISHWKHKARVLQTYPVTSWDITLRLALPCLLGLGVLLLIRVLQLFEGITDEASRALSLTMFPSVILAVCQIIISPRHCRSQ
jgi:hypothetical protein